MKKPKSKFRKQQDDIINKDNEPKKSVKTPNNQKKTPKTAEKSENGSTPNEKCDKQLN